MTKSGVTKIILIDFNQVVIANLMQQINYDHKIELNENLLRHMVLNSVRYYVSRFRAKYGEVVIACDSREYWRKEIFPPYKANRKKSRDNSKFDWGMIFDSITKISEELRENFPYRVLNVHGAEADDIIAVLAARASTNEDVLILSSDKDFLQLQKYRRISQFSPALKAFVKTDNPSRVLKEHIIRGDFDDGVPNILSSDNVFLLGQRQKSINTKKLEEWVRLAPEEFSADNEVMLHGFRRNEKLIDLSKIPDDIVSRIIEAYEEAEPKSRQKMFSYFIENRLTNLMESLQEF